jgi:hypothetical protein
MMESAVDFLPRDRNLFRPFATLGEALREIARNRWRAHTAKEAARAWGLEPSTGESLTRGHASERTVVKAIRGEGKEGWALWDALGELIIGESRDEYDERRLATIMEEAALARSRLEDRRSRRLALEGRAPQFDALVDR